MATGDIELAQLQDAAKSRGLGLWAYVTEVAQTDEDTSPAQEGSSASTLIPVRVCEIVDGCTFYVQRRDEQGTRDMAVVQDTMAAFSTVRLWIDSTLGPGRNEFSLLKVS